MFIPPSYLRCKLVCMFMKLCLLAGKRQPRKDILPEKRLDVRDILAEKRKFDREKLQ
jgi:hypothetical protein